jgi:hypothetical protein
MEDFERSDYKNRHYRFCGKQIPVIHIYDSWIAGTSPCNDELLAGASKVPFLSFPTTLIVFPA